jgi:hypothetical protein
MWCIEGATEVQARTLVLQVVVVVVPVIQQTVVMLQALQQEQEIHLAVMELQVKPIIKTVQTVQLMAVLVPAVRRRMVV